MYIYICAVIIKIHIKSQPIYPFHETKLEHTRPRDEPELLAMPASSNNCFPQKGKGKNGKGKSKNKSKNPGGKGKDGSSHDTHEKPVKTVDQRAKAASCLDT